VDSTIDWWSGWFTQTMWCAGDGALWFETAGITYGPYVVLDGGVSDTTDLRITGAAGGAVKLFIDYICMVRL
jgi:hypothetical protein